MKKITFFAAVMLFSAWLPSWTLGQERPFSWSARSNEFAAGYTAGSVLSLGNIMENIFWQIIVEPIDPLVSSKGTSWGGISVGYNYWLNRHVAVGGTFAFSEDNLTEQRKTTGEWTYSTGFISLMMTMKLNYVTTSWIDIYGRTDLGGTVIAGTSTNAGKIDEYAGLFFAGQFSPLCFRVGKTFNFFLEAGFGTIGLVNTGFNVRF